MNQHFIKIMFLFGIFILLFPTCNLPQTMLPTNTPNKTQPEVTATLEMATTSIDQTGFIFLVALKNKEV